MLARLEAGARCVPATPGASVAGSSSVVSKRGARWQRRRREEDPHGGARSVAAEEEEEEGYSDDDGAADDVRLASPSYMSASGGSRLAATPRTPGERRAAGGFDESYDEAELAEMVTRVAADGEDLLEEGADLEVADRAPLRLKPPPPLSTWRPPETVCLAAEVPAELTLRADYGHGHGYGGGRSSRRPQRSRRRRPIMRATPRPSRRLGGGASGPRRRLRPLRLPRRARGSGRRGTTW